MNWQQIRNSAVVVLAAVAVGGPLLQRRRRAGCFAFGPSNDGNRALERAPTDGNTATAVAAIDRSYPDYAGRPRRLEEAPVWGPGVSSAGCGGGRAPLSGVRGGLWGRRGAREAAFSARPRLASGPFTRPVPGAAPAALASRRSEAEGL